VRSHVLTTASITLGSYDFFLCINIKTVQVVTNEATEVREFSGLIVS